MDNLIFSNMLHRPARTFVSVVGIAIGVLLIVFTVGLANGSIREQAKREGNVGAEILIRASGSAAMAGSDSFRLEETLADEIQNIQGVKQAVGIGQVSIDAADSNIGKRTIDGINYESYKQMSGFVLMDGRPFNENADEAIIDTGWQKQRNFQIGDKLSIFDRDFTIVGTYEPAGGQRIKIPLKLMQDFTGIEGKVSTILVKVAEGHSVEEVGNRINEAFPDKLFLIKTEELEELYMSGIPALNVFLNVFIGIAAVISALVILMTMYTTVTERTRQIGILKSLGMNNTNIALLITQESILISVLGIILGVIATFILRIFINQFTTLEVEINFVVISIVFIVGLIGAVIGALYPAMRAARLDAVEALSYD